MSALEFIASVAWPLAVLMIAIMFRRPITVALASATGNLKAGPFALEWKRTISTVEAELGRPRSISEGKVGGPAGKLDEVAQVAPAAAIVEAYGQIEATLRSLLEKHNVQGLENQWSVPKLARLAHQQGLITAETMQGIEGLGVLRNLAAHGRETDLSVQRAHEFVALAEGVIFAINAGA